MMFNSDYCPNYKNIVSAAFNEKPPQIPIYEHIIAEEIMEEIMDTKFAGLQKGDKSEKRQYIKNYTKFYKNMGYDTVSFERLITDVMPGSGALYKNKDAIIKTREDFKNYPWPKIEEQFFLKYKYFFQYLAEEMPAGMKAVGGPGNGVFECVQDLVGFEQLCYIRGENPKLYADLFAKMGQVMYKIWGKFLEHYEGCYALFRFGDDLGFKTSTLLPPEDIKKHIIPVYSRIIELVHDYGKPFLLHSCGNIFNVMDLLIENANINAKHSNEDTIAPFSEWINRYGDRIGNFGGVDTKFLYDKDKEEIIDYVKDIMKLAQKYEGVAVGTGNSIPDYIPVENYLIMIKTIRELRN